MSYLLIPFVRLIELKLNEMIRSKLLKLWSYLFMYVQSSSFIVTSVVSVQSHIITLGLMEHMVIHGAFLDLAVERQSACVHQFVPLQRKVQCLAFLYQGGYLLHSCLTVREGTWKGRELPNTACQRQLSANTKQGFFDYRGPDSIIISSIQWCIIPSYTLLYSLSQHKRKSSELQMGLQ